MISNESYVIGENLDATKSEHLSEGFRPIIACVGTREDFGDTLKDLELELIDSGLEHIKWTATVNELNIRNIKNDGRSTYLISELNEASKFSDRYMDCTGIVIVGQDMVTGKEVSIMTHQSPEYFLKEGNREKFLNDLHLATQELRDKCVPGSIDAVVFGGNDIPEYDVKTTKDYQESKIVITKAVLEDLGFPPVFIDGPKKIPGQNTVVFDTQNRRLYILQPKLKLDTK